MNERRETESEGDERASHPRTTEPVVPVPPAAVPAVLTEFSNTIDEWLAEHVDEFDPLVWTSTDDRDFRRKAFSELSLYLHVRGISGVPASATPLRELVERRVNDPRYYTLLYRNPDKFLALSYPFAYVNGRGSLGPDATAAVERTLSGPVVWSTEKVPHRLMDLWCFCSMYGYDAGLVLDDVLRLSCLRYLPDAATASTMDVYALTHNLLFYHNFGVEHRSFPAGPSPYDVEELVTGLTLRFVAEDDADVVAELLAVGVLERKLSPRIVRLVLGWLRTKLTSDGYVLGPQRDESGDQSRRLDEWEANYHTTIATSMAVEVLKREWAELSREDSRADTEAPVPVEDLLTLGDVLHSLATYDLERAAHGLLDLAESPVVDRYPRVLTNAVEYVRSQQTVDGTFGFFADERALYVALGGDFETFAEQFVDPITTACTSALDAYAPDAASTVGQQPNARATDRDQRTSD